jgi:hypothetical protein
MASNESGAECSLVPDQRDGPFVSYFHFHHMSDTKQLDFFNEQRSRGKSPLRYEQSALPPPRDRLGSVPLGERRRPSLSDRRRNRYGTINPLQEHESSNLKRESSIQSTWLQDQLGRTEKAKGLRNTAGVEEYRRNSSDGMQSLSLSRTLSWPPHERKSSLIPQQADVAFYTLSLMKKNRHGSFQKRLVRIDGTLLVCFSSKTDVFKRFVTDADLMDSPHETVRVDLKDAMKLYYPHGTIPALAQAILSSSTFQPDPFTPNYLIPKWVIPVESITSIKTNIGDEHPESKESRTFTVVTRSRSYTFQAATSSELLRFKYLLDSVSHQPTMDEASAASETIRVLEQQRKKMQKYQEQQESFKRVLHSIIQHDSKMKSRVMTLQSSGSGMKLLPGVVIQPLIPQRPVKDSFSRFSLQRRLVEQAKEEIDQKDEVDSLYELVYNDSLPISAIERQIQELDEELASLAPSPNTYR